MYRMEKRAACSIQRLFRIIKIRNAIKVLNYNKDIIENNTFEEFIKKIQDKRVLSLVNYILTKITGIVQYGKGNILTPQNFLSAFVIYGYSAEIINEEPGIIRPISNINKIIVDSSKKVVNMFDTFLYNINLRSMQKFAYLLIDYKIIFDSWKIKDHNKLIHILTISYYELDDVIKEVKNTLPDFENPENTEKDNEPITEKIHYITICRERQEDIINKIIYLNGQNYFNNYEREEITLDKSIQQQIKETLHTAFWQMLYEDLASKPPQYDRLISLLIELRDTFCNLVPNRSDIREEIHEHIDVDLIKNMIEHNAFDDENLQKLAVYILSLIKKFQPQIMDEDVNNWEQKMLEQFNTKFEYSDFLVTFFRSVFNMLDNIVLSAKKFIEELEQNAEQ